MKQVELLFIPAHGKVRKIVIKPTLDILQAWVGGDIEEIYISNGQIMIANEHGRHLQLPRNETASLIALHEIVGDVLIASGVDKDGNLLPYTKSTGRPTESI